MTLPAAAQTTYYVDDDSSCTSSCGSSWATAYPDLQEALAAASDGDTIRVAEGTYKPTAGTDRCESFEMVNGVVLEGGYAADYVEPDLRDPAMYETILSGNIGSSYSGDNSYHVVTADASVIDLDTTLDGFIIKLGYADGSYPDNAGGGIYIGGFLEGEGEEEDTASGKLTVQNCTITANFASLYGGGVYVNELGQIRMLGCTMSNNTATSYGGGYADGRASAAFEDCAFIDNETTNTYEGGGGGAWVGPLGTTRTFLRCRFTGNEVPLKGGAVGVSDGTSQQPQFTNCLFYRNHTTDTTSIGGAIWTNDVIHLTNCTFAKNTCGLDEGGAAIYVAGDYEPLNTIKNSILWDNDASGAHDDEADGIKVLYGADEVTMANTCLQNLSSAEWIGGGNNNDNPLFRNVSADNYELNPINCGGGDCDSQSIDRGEDDNCGGTCNSGGDILAQTRKVNLDDLDDDVDMGSQETQELDE